MLLDEVDKLLVVDVAGAHDHHVFSKVVARVEVNDHLAIDLSDVVNVTEDGLPHHMVSEAVEVNVLHQSLLRVLVGSL